jgi:hypothetical protein
MPTNYRKIDKTYLTTILSTITFDGKALPVFAGHKRNDSLPYIFITSAKTAHDGDYAEIQLDNRTYYRKLGYNINLVYILDENEAKNAIIEDSVDEIEQLLLDKFENEAVQNCAVASGVNPWQDLIFRGSSEEFAGENINLKQGTLVRAFFIDVYHLTSKT